MRVATSADWRIRSEHVGARAEARNRLIGSGQSNRPSNTVRVLMECFKSLEHSVAGPRTAPPLGSCPDVVWVTTNSLERVLPLRREAVGVFYSPSQQGWIYPRYKIKDSVEEKQSPLAWQIIYEVSGRKSTSRSKLKAACQEKIRLKWKEY